jgi:hypothetical protein
MALALLDCVPPPAVHGLGKPVIEVPGLTPTAPLFVDEPVQVTPAPPRTEYPDDPTNTGEVAAKALAVQARPKVNISVPIILSLENLLDIIISTSCYFIKFIV